MFKYMIWDFDGTLFDTYPGMTLAFQKALKDIGVEDSEENIHSHLKVSVGDAIKYYENNYNIDSEFHDRFIAYENKGDEKLQPPFPLAKEICQLILEKGGENFILTHRGKSVFRLLKYYNMSHYFTDVVTGEDGFKRKPDPEAFLHLIVKHGLDKNETLGIGDRELDIVAGNNSGIKTCYLNFDNRPILTNGDFQFKSMEELFNFLK